MADDAKSSAKPEPISLKEFFEKVSPGKATDVKDIAEIDYSHGAANVFLLPVLNLHCDHQDCEGVRSFDPPGTIRLSPRHSKEVFIKYTCRNCQATQKTFATWVYLEEDGETGKIYKYGEVPAFGPPTPAKVASLFGSDREYYFKGRRSENQGLGIAAFAYYRRVIESRKNKIFDEIIRVSEKIGADQTIIDDLKTAKGEQQFSTAVEALKHGFPPALKINGQNPLTLIHSALSEGLHSQDDETCLEMATHIRVVLTELVERMSTVLKEDTELTKAVARLQQKKGEKSGKGAKPEMQT